MLGYWELSFALVSMPHAKEPPRMRSGYHGMPKCLLNDPNLLMSLMYKCGNLLIPCDAKYLLGVPHIS